MFKYWLGELFCDTGQHSSPLLCHQQSTTDPVEGKVLLGEAHCPGDLRAMHHWLSTSDPAGAGESPSLLPLSFCN